MIEVKIASYKEAKIVSDVAVKTFRESFGYLFDDAEIESFLRKTFACEKIESDLRENNNIFSLAYFNGAPVGYYKLKLFSGAVDQFDPDAVQIHKIYLLKEFQGRHIGGHLLRHLLSLPQLFNFNYLWLLVLDTNLRAISFYQKYGFVKTAKRPFQIMGQEYQYDLMIRNRKYIDENQH